MKSNGVRAGIWRDIEKLLAWHIGVGNATDTTLIEVGHLGDEVGYGLRDAYDLVGLVEINTFDVVKGAVGIPCWLPSMTYRPAAKADSLPQR
jgi:hypothetical protein